MKVMKPGLMRSRDIREWPIDSPSDCLDALTHAVHCFDGQILGHGHFLFKKKYNSYCIETLRCNNALVDACVTVETKDYLEFKVKPVR